MSSGKVCTWKRWQKPQLKSLNWTIVIGALVGPREGSPSVPISKRRGWPAAALALASSAAA